MLYKTLRKNEKSFPQRLFMFFNSFIRSYGSSSNSVSASCEKTPENYRMLTHLTKPPENVSASRAKSSENYRKLTRLTRPPKKMCQYLVQNLQKTTES